MKDIEIIPPLNVHSSFRALPNSYDRVCAIEYFMKEHIKKIETNRDHSNWNFRAALSEFKSIFDVLPGDLKAINAHTIWKNSEFYEKADKSALLSILKKDRDLTVHTSQYKGSFKIVGVLRAEGDEIRNISCNWFFFDEIEMNTRSQFKNLNDNEIDWFNKQARLWPAHMLLTVGIDELGTCINHFFGKHCNKIHVQ